MQGGNDNNNDGNGIVYDANGDTNNNIDHGDNYNYEDLNYIDINLFHWNSHSTNLGTS